MEHIEVFLNNSKIVDVNAEDGLYVPDDNDWPCWLIDMVNHMRVVFYVQKRESVSFNTTALRKELIKHNEGRDET